MFVRFLVLAVLAGVLVIGCGSTPASIREHLVKIEGHEEEYNSAKEVAKDKDKVAKEAKTESDKADEEAKKKAEKLAESLVNYAEYLRGEMEKVFQRAKELDPKVRIRQRDPIDQPPGGREAPAPVPIPPPSAAPPAPLSPVTPPPAVPDLNQPPPAPKAQVDWYIKEFSFGGMRRLTEGNLPERWEFGVAHGQALMLRVNGVVVASVMNDAKFKPGCYSFTKDNWGPIRVSEVSCPPGVMSQ